MDGDQDRAMNRGLVNEGNSLTRPQPKKSEIRNQKFFFPPSISTSENRMSLTIHIDGGSRGNPGPAAAAVVIHREGRTKPIHEAGYFLGKATNNVAEYQGLLRALQIAAKLPRNQIKIKSDSELMVRQLTGQYKVKSDDLRPLFEEAQMMLLNFDTWSIKHVLRDKNKRADELANMALDAGRDVVVVDAITSRSEDSDARSGDPEDDTDAPAPLPMGSQNRRNRGKTVESDDANLEFFASAEHEDEGDIEDADQDQGALTPLLPGLVRPDADDDADPPAPTPAPQHEAATKPALTPSASSPATDCPKWIARLSEQPNGATCPARHRRGQMFSFGPTTPGGLCLFAAEAILVDGPLCWSDPRRTDAHVTCPRCKVSIEIQRSE